jgi:hypothetical protein
VVPAKPKVFTICPLETNLPTFGFLDSMGMLIFFLHIFHTAFCVKEIVSHGYFPIAVTAF